MRKETASSQHQKPGNIQPSSAPSLGFFTVDRRGLVLIKPPRWLRKFLLFCGRHQLATRIGCIIAAAVIFFSLIYAVFNQRINRLLYQLSPKAQALLIDSSPLYADSLHFSQQTNSFIYNEDYKPPVDGVGGVSGSPKFSAEFSADPTEGVRVTDPFSKVSFSIKPNFPMAIPRKQNSRLIYPLLGKRATKVITLGATGYKEDVILKSFRQTSLSLQYDLKLPAWLEPRLESNGSLAIYGPADSSLLGDVSTASDRDAQLLSAARKKAAKTQLLFRMPAPYIREYGDKIAHKSHVHFELDGNKLSVVADNLQNMTYPLSIDPSIYVATAAELMRGNNETNTDFDVDNELIQKSQTTGARIDAWQGNLDMSQPAWDIGTAAAGGYVYRTGGRTGSAGRPQIVDQAETNQNSNSSNFTMDMPASRPAGDLYIALMCHDGSNGSGGQGGNGGNDISPPAGWTEYADLQGHAAYYKVGTDQGGGDEASSYTWSGNNEKWGGVIVRVTDFDSSDPISGTPGTGYSTGSSVPDFPAVTPDNNSTLIIRAVGADNDEPSNTGWVPSGNTKIASGGPTGTQDCAYAAATLDSSPASGVSSGTAGFNDTSINDDYGASAIAINPVSGSSPSTLSSVNWARFNSSTRAIESPNPGAGACSGWCNDTAYDLPSGRRGHAMVAYNGYLYVVGGLDDSGARTSTIYIAKLGANGEPQLWHPTDSDKSHWDYWYTGSGATLNGSTAKSYLSAVAYNNRMYILGGQTNASPGGVTTVEEADILPNGTLGSWTTSGMQALPSGAGTYMNSVQIYNDTIYAIGGFEGAQTSSSNLRSSVYYSKLNSDGTMNSWQSTGSFSTARASFGGSMAAIFGAYIYLGGGCTAVNASGYCTSIAGDMQLASINADGTLDEWGSLGTLDNTRIGYSFIAWQGGLYRLGGCTLHDGTSGECTSTLADVDYGVINPAGEVSTVNITEPSGTSPCSGGSPTNCDLPPPGDDAGEGGQLLTMSVIHNGYLYVIGGCIDYDCNGTNPAGDDADVTGNISYVSIASDGSLQAPASCPGTSYGAWCVDSTNRINGTTGVAAAGVTTFNGRIYVIGGLTGSGISPDIYYNTTNDDGSLSGTWSSVDMTTAGISDDVAYTYAYARSNPASASTSPGNLYIFGGCGNASSGAGCGNNDYRTEVYKCNIAVSGSVSGCTTTGQLQIDSTPGTGGNDGLGIHSGTVYANYIYLIGGYSQAEADKDDVLYAKFDDSNNVVAVSGSDWIESPNKLSVGRRRGWAFGYNGHIYAVGGYDDSGTGIIPFIEWSKMNVSNGEIDPFVTSAVTINQRWGLSMVVSNSYAYVIGGCNVGSSPSGCSSFEPSIQTFQLYNNDSGAPGGYSDSANLFASDRFGTSAAVVDGYIYVAGGCVSTTADCDDATNSVQYAPIDAYGTLGSWSATSANLPSDRAWGQLEAAGGTLYYIGGQSDTASDERSEVYYGTPSSGDVSGWSTASNGLPSARTQFSSAVWNNRIYVTGGNDSAGAPTNTIYISPQLNSGGDIGSAWSSDSDVFDVARSGHTTIAYANNLYILGGYDGAYYLNDVQFTQINSDGTVDAWTFSTRLPESIRQADGFASNGYMYLIGGRTADGVCDSNTLIAPISANTTIASGNNPTGIGEWYETNKRYDGDRYGNAAVYYKGQAYVVGGACITPGLNTTTYSSSGADTYDVPAGVTSITVKTWGGGGGGGGGSTNGDGGDGGGGGYATTTLSVTPLETLNVVVGGGGGAGDFSSGGSGSSSGDGGGGGGHSEVNRSGTPLIIASGGGGGGGGDNSSSATGGAGGPGGDTSSGGNGGSSGSANGGNGGTSSGGGNGGSGGNNSGSAGGSQSGGAGADGRTGNGADGSKNNGGTNNGGDGGNGDENGNGYGAGGGGGSGYFGGGGGSGSAAGNAGGGGGGGGSSYVTGSGTSSASGSGTSPGNSGDSDRAGAGGGGSGGGSTGSGSTGADGIVLISYATTPTVTYTGSDRVTQTTILSQPQVAKYSRMIDTDSDVFPNSWLVNGLDNSIGARWQARYRSMNDTDGVPSDCGSADMSTWGVETNFGDVTLGDVAPYVPRDGSGNDIECARYFYFFISIDASQTFGYPEDVSRGPTLTDLSLFFTSDPSKRLRHGKTFTGGQLQPLDTPCRQSNDPDCPLP